MGCNVTIKGRDCVVKRDVNSLVSAGSKVFAMVT